MSDTAPVTPVLEVVLGPGDAAALAGALAGERDASAWRITGPGALDCLQGIFSNDVVAPGDRLLAYGAFLSAKGMILTDGWVIRADPDLVVLAPAPARDTLAELFRRSFPPRLARASDAGSEWCTAWLAGGAARGVLERWLGADAPAPGRVVRGADGLLVAAATAPFTALLTGPAASVEAALAGLGKAGAAPASPDQLEAMRILAGWPSLGAEIDEKTLPQEVRFDELGGVSYTKGCYVGQETVARLHFRGHANRELRGLAWDGAGPSGDAITREGKPVGRIRSVLRLPGRTLGLAPIRREVSTGEIVEAGGAPARVVGLPFEGPERTAAPVG